MQSVRQRALLRTGALLLVAACAPAVRTTPTPPAQPVAAQPAAPRALTPTPVPARVARPSPSGRPDRGAWLVVVKGCAACHGVQAEGNVVGPALAGTRLSYETVLGEIRTPHHPKMPPFTTADLSDTDAADIYAFLQSKSTADR